MSELLSVLNRSNGFTGFISIEGNVTKHGSVSFWAYGYVRVARMHRIRGAIAFLVGRCIGMRVRSPVVHVAARCTHETPRVAVVFSGSRSPLSKNSELFQVYEERT